MFIEINNTYSFIIDWNGYEVGRLRTDGVYIDDISDWGKNLGKTNHLTAIPAVQIQEEVLLNSEKIKL
ncbi:hypothetical protein BXU10_16415 [Flavobacterium sp. LM4]|nr:hypothetical protein BXU10_16415 [Flavobacterium sp. LM4]